MMKNNSSNRFFYAVALVSAMMLTLPLFAPNLKAQMVYEPELMGVGPVDFINFEGPHFRIDTFEQIRDIGYSLGLAARAGVNRPGELNRYFVIRSISPPDGNRLDADIFGIGADAAVDHITNLRLIIQGYLEAAFGYTPSDAALLAQYITIYNAVYRGDWDFFVSRYKVPVIGYLVRERAGLSLRYDEWPGQTLMLIPLGGMPGAPLAAAVDTVALNDERVLAHLRDEPDMGLDLRREMVDLLEREADAAALEAVIVREAIAEEEARLAQEIFEAQVQQQEALQQQQEALQQIAQVAEARQEDYVDHAALDQQEEAALQQLAQAEEQIQAAEAVQEELAQAQEALQEQEQLAQAQEAFAEERLEVAQQERQQIAEDLQVIIDATPPPAIIAEGILGTTILTYGSTPLGRIVHFFPDTGVETRRSPLSTVNVRTVTIVGNRLLAIAGENRGNSAVRLVEIDPVSLEMIRQGENNIAQGSHLWLNGQNIFALLDENGSFFMGRFDADLRLQARSTVQVHAFASALFDGGSILTQRPDGSPLALNPISLLEVR